MNCTECDSPYMVQNHGTCLICELHISDRLRRNTFSYSRHRKAKWMDAAAVALLMALMMALGVIAWASTAKADDDVSVYADMYQSAICGTLDDYHSLSGVVGLVNAITDDGYTMGEAVDIVNRAVLDHCPDNWALLQSVGRAARAN